MSLSRALSDSADSRRERQQWLRELRTLERALSDADRKATRLERRLKAEQGRTEYWKTATAKAKGDAGIDEATKLLRLKRFERDFTSWLREDRRRSAEGLSALWFIDLHKFKAINTLVGHPRANVVINKVAKLIQKHIRSKGENVLHGRHGGDELLALVPNLNHVNDIFTISERLDKEIAAHNWLREIKLKKTLAEPLVVRAYIGVAYFRHASLNAALEELSKKQKKRFIARARISLIQTANDAMYFARRITDGPMIAVREVLFEKSG